MLSLDPEMRRFHTRVRDSCLPLDVSTLLFLFFFGGRFYFKPPLILTRALAWLLHYMVTPVIIKDGCG